MTQAGPLQWISGDGWLVLVGGRSAPGDLTEIDDRLLARADFSRPIAFLPTAAGSWTGEALLDQYAALGGPPGYVVPILAPADAQDAENCQMLAEAGLILIGDGDGLTLARALWDSRALAAMAEAFDQGALIAGIGAGAAPLGEWIVAESDSAEGGPGWGWIRGAIVAPYFGGSAHSPLLPAVLRKHAGLVGLGIPTDVALALGPRGEVETWGEEVTVVVAH
ncbi:MAG: Type 1 glutamine amidotransferase-like domain-containing protein [Anaerolineae bacterium]|nr:Type 1 glutamine amidotransferase-like domain-containing protein [Anaerolineae bacterium]